jgi:hypothetical protein
MTSSIKQFTLVTATMMALVMGSGLSARAATASGTGLSMNPALGSGSSVWTWPIDKEARSHVWIDARSGKVQSAQPKARFAQLGPRSALRKGAELGGL